MQVRGRVILSARELPIFSCGISCDIVKYSILRSDRHSRSGRSRNDISEFSSAIHKSSDRIDTRSSKLFENQIDTELSSGEKLAGTGVDWRKVVLTGENWHLTGANWRKLDETGENWSKLASGWWRPARACAGSMAERPSALKQDRSGAFSALPEALEIR